MPMLGKLRRGQEKGLDSSCGSSPSAMLVVAELVKLSLIAKLEVLLLHLYCS